MYRSRHYPGQSTVFSHLFFPPLSPLPWIAIALLVTQSTKFQSRSLNFLYSLGSWLSFYSFFPFPHPCLLNLLSSLSVLPSLVLLQSIFSSTFSSFHSHFNDPQNFITSFFTFLLSLPLLRDTMPSPPFPLYLPSSIPTEPEFPPSQIPPYHYPLPCSFTPFPSISPSSPHPTFPNKTRQEAINKTGLPGGRSRLKPTRSALQARGLSWNHSALPPTFAPTFSVPWRPIPIPIIPRRRNFFYDKNFPQISIPWV